MGVSPRIGTSRTNPEFLQVQVSREVETWRNRPLQPFYPFAFVDCIYVSLRTEYGIQQAAVYVMLAYDVNGRKDVLVLWINETVRKIMYTTNAIESVNSSFRKVTKKGAFPNEDAVFKIFYLHVLELYKKWKGRHIANWAMVRNRLLMDDRMSQLMQQYDVAY